MSQANRNDGGRGGEVDTAQREHSEHHEAASGAPYVLALFALLVLTALSFGLHFVSLGTVGTFIAFGIASVKVLVVAIIFMHLRESMAATRLVAFVSVLFVMLLCFGIVTDIAFR